MNRHLSRLFTGLYVLTIFTLIALCVFIILNLFGPLGLLLILVGPLAYLLGWIHEN